MAAVGLYTDPSILTGETVVFRSMNGTSDSNLTFSASSGASPVRSVADGFSSWAYTSSVSDARATWSDSAGSVDHTTYPWFRIRYRQSATASGTPQVWENPARGGEGLTFSATTAWTEYHSNIPNPAPAGTGFRLDPFINPVAGDAFYIDYVMLDRNETMGIGEFDRQTDFENWSLGNITGGAVNGGVLSGTATVVDAQIGSASGPTINANIFKYVTLRMRSTTPSELFWASAGGFVGGQRIDFGIGDNAFHDYLFDMSAEPTWTGTNMRIRIDPTLAANATFEVESIRLSVIPEPGTALLLAGGLLLLSRFRRLRA